MAAVHHFAQSITLRDRGVDRHFRRAKWCGQSTENDAGAEGDPLHASGATLWTAHCRLA